MLRKAPAACHVKSKLCGHFSSIGKLLQYQKFGSHYFGCLLPSHSTNMHRYSSTAYEIDPPPESSSYSYFDFSKLEHPIKKWPKEFPERRMDKLTASTFAGAIGYWPRRRVQLWREKVGIKEIFKGSLATLWDVNKERDALQRYMEITRGRYDVHCVTSPVFHAEKDWLAASPDGVISHPQFASPDVVISHPQFCGVLEIKCPCVNGEGNRASPYRRVPLYYIPQAQGLMEILDLEMMHIYIWTPNGSSLFRLYRDVEYWDLLEVALSDFWWNHVEPARELISKSAGGASLTEIDRLRPAPKHELCHKIVCESHRVLQNTELLFREVNEILQQ